MRRLEFAAAAVGYVLLAAVLVHADVPSTTPSAFQQPSVDYAAGTASQSIVSADVDGDGNVDLIVANNESDDVSVLYGVGDGTFEDAVSLAVLFGPSAVQVGDMNKDGSLDIVVAHDFESVVATLLQVSPREFHLEEAQTTGDGPLGLALADFNRDGNLDAVTANNFDISGTVSYLRGLGDGTFATAVSIVVGEDTEPFAVVAADVNNDLKADLVVADSGTSDVAVLLGNGAGMFSEPGLFTVGAAPVSVAVSDLNIDGKPDIATANEDDFTVSVLYGNGDGTFGTEEDPVQTIEVGSSPEAVAIWDFNLDGRPDICVANTIDDSDGVTILRGNGDGTYQDNENFAIGGFLPSSVATGTFTGNGIRGIATANVDVPETAVSVLLNEGSVLRGDANVDGVVNDVDLNYAVSELFDGDGAVVITVAGGSLASGPGVDGNGDESVNAADFVAITTLAVGNQG